MAGITSEQEREFEAQHITRRRDRYLATDVMAKVRDDRGYAEKISVIEQAIVGTTDWILDVGANTCGESEYLTTRGYKIIGNDINQVALEVSQERCARFGRLSPRDPLNKHCFSLCFVVKRTISDVAGYGFGIAAIL